MNAWYDSLSSLLGLDLQSKDYSFLQVSLRGIIVLMAGLIMIRIGKKRSLAQKTAFDTALIVILASVLARDINGTAPFFPTLGGAFIMVILHRFFGWIAGRSHAFGLLIKGRPEIIVEDGQPLGPVMRRNHISIHDLQEDLRCNAATDDFATIQVARVERSGSISFIKK